VDYSPSGATEIRAAGKSFLEMRDRIERHIEQRTMMLSGVSHDLRTPLTRLKLGLSMMEEGEDVRALNRDVEDMRRLLDEFLNFGQGGSGDSPDCVDPHDIVRQAVENARRTGGNVVLALVSGQGDMVLRPTAILRAIENLIGNSMRYGEYVEVSSVLGDGGLEITVEDDGPGIAPENREEALKPFSRLEPARNQNRGTGVGLGLAIAVDIARAHGGGLSLHQSARLGGLKVVFTVSR
jgi:two-component system osmolarity sensor histidine kinase EnvZ